MKVDEKNILHDFERDLLPLVSKHPVIMSCLYDIDMMPEQLKRGTREWCHMLIIIQHFQFVLEPHPTPVEPRSE